MSVERPFFTKPILAGVCACATIAAAVFLIWPEIDLTIAKLFYDDGFFWRTEETNALRKILMRAPFLLAVPLAFAILVKVIWPQSRCLLDPRPALAALFALAMGPGLIVNGILKEHWGRPRPTHVLSDGDPFLPPIIPWDVCATNCSFVSGEAAAGFWLIALSLFFTGAARVWTFWGAVVFAVVTGLLRMSFGGHFLSDVLFAFFVSYICVYWGVWLFCRTPRDVWEKRLGAIRQTNAPKR